MTQTANRSDTPANPLVVETVPKRPLLSRLSLGHLIMVLAGLLAFLLVLAVLRDRGETVQIAVAVEQIDAGTTIERSDIRFASINDAEPALLLAFLSPDIVNQAISDGWVATRTLSPGIPLTTTDLRREGLDADLRAMSIPIDAGHAANGAIVSGDRVDIIVVRRGIAEYVATNVEVIAVGVGTSATSRGFALTVAVDDATSLKLAVAINDGAIELVRSTGAAVADPGAVYPPQTPAADPGGG